MVNCRDSSGTTFLDLDKVRPSKLFPRDLDGASTDFCWTEPLFPDSCVDSRWSFKGWGSWCDDSSGKAGSTSSLLSQPPILCKVRRTEEERFLEGSNLGRLRRGSGMSCWSAWLLLVVGGKSCGITIELTIHSSRHPRSCIRHPNSRTKAGWTRTKNYSRTQVVQLLCGFMV